MFERGGWHAVLGVAGYVGAFLTAIYTFRMIFRAFHGEMCPEAEELSHGHLYHAPEPTNPATGEVEDTDVGFPGPEHHIAERAAPMKVAMGALALLAIIGGFLQIPGVTDELHHFLEPTFADSELYEELEPTASAEWLGLGDRRAASASPASRSRGGSTGTAATRPALQARFTPLHTLLRQQVVLRRGDRLPDRPPDGLVRALRQQHVRARVRQRRAGRRLDRRGAHAVGRRARHPVGLPALLRRAAARRPHRPRRLLPDLRMTIHLSILIFFPLVLRRCWPRSRRARRAEILLVGTLVPLVYAVMHDHRLRRRPAGLQHVTDDAWISELGIRYKLGVDGLNLWLIALTTAVAFACAIWLVVRPPERAGLFAFHFGLGETRRAGRVRGPGPGAVRPLLRPDAGAVLLPGRPVGRAGPGRRRR